MLGIDLKIKQSEKIFCFSFESPQFYHPCFMFSFSPSRNYEIFRTVMLPRSYWNLDHRDSSALLIQALISPSIL